MLSVKCYNIYFWTAILFSFFYLIEKLELDSVSGNSSEICCLRPVCWFSTSIKDTNPTFSLQTALLKKIQIYFTDP